MDDTTMMRAWWDEKANLGFERLSNQDWRDERLFFATLFTMRDYFHLLTLWSLNKFLIYTHAKRLPPTLGACF